jgi:hypothetical protein
MEKFDSDSQLIEVSLWGLRKSSDIQPLYHRSQPTELVFWKFTLCITFSLRQHHLAKTWAA